MKTKTRWVSCQQLLRTLVLGGLLSKRLNFRRHSWNASRKGQSAFRAKGFDPARIDARSKKSAFKKWVGEKENDKTRWSLGVSLSCWPTSELPKHMFIALVTVLATSEETFHGHSAYDTAKMSQFCWPQPRDAKGFAVYLGSYKVKAVQPITRTSLLKPNILIRLETTHTDPDLKLAYCIIALKID